MVTVAGALELMPSFATRRNVKAVSAVTSGGVNVGVALVAESSTTAGPSVWVHVKRSVSPSASVEPDASSVTLPERSSTVVGPPSFTPATATGRLFTFVTMTCTTLGRLESVPSLTTSWNVKMVFVETDALKLGGAVERHRRTTHLRPRVRQGGAIRVEAPRAVERDDRRGPHAASAHDDFRHR